MVENFCDLSLKKHLVLSYCISLSTATYQRIKPVAPPSGKGQDSSSSYSVTLFIGDRETPSVTATASSDSVRRESSGLPMRSYMSLPRPPNKSVFRKFFGKKEWRTLSVSLTDMCRTQVPNIVLTFIYGSDGEPFVYTFWMRSCMIVLLQDVWCLTSSVVLISSSWMV